MIKNHIGRALGLAVLGGVIMAPTSAFAIPGLFPTTLSENTTGFDDSIFTGAPDDVFVGLGGQIVTYDFGTARIADGSGQDFNVYEVDIGGAQFGDIDVSVSLNGLDFFLVDNTIAAMINIDGDEAHSDPAFARSYDISGTGLTEVRFVRIDGIGTQPASFNRLFDLDAIGAINFSDVPEPSTLALLGMGLLGIGWARRRRGTA